MTCQDYWNDPKPANGAYDLYDQTGVLYKAFCDFHTEEGLAWTLVLSRSRVTVLPPLLQDFPARNLASPENGVMWNEYSLARCGFIMFLKNIFLFALDLYPVTQGRSTKSCL
jgi:hypothetical protein